jgi:hypothetical protein
VRCHEAAASFFLAKVRGEVFAHFHAVAIKGHNSMQELTVWIAMMNSLLSKKTTMPCARNRACSS